MRLHPALLIGVIAVCGCAAADRRTADLPEHHTAQGFRNPYNDEADRMRFFGYIKARYFGDLDVPDYAEQRHRVPRREPELERIQTPDPDVAQLTWIGHSTALIQYRGVNLLTDPIFSERASPSDWFGPKRYVPAALTVEQLPRIDYVIISHNHYDHLDEASVKALGDGPLWLVPLKIMQWFLDQGIAPERVVELDWWQTRRIDSVTATPTPAQHFSGRSLWDHNETLWCSWAVDLDGLKIWFGGDTGYNEVQFKEIGGEGGPFHLALIPIGAFLPRDFMRPVHVNPAEAVRIHQDIRSRFSVGVHWGAFQFASEDIDEPKLELERAARAAAANFTTLAVGETRVIDMQ